MQIKNKIIELIDNLNHELKESKELELALKSKLTKKEFKLLKALAYNENLEKLKITLKLDEKRYKDIYSKLIKKLNNEAIKYYLSKDTQ